MAEQTPNKPDTDRIPWSTLSWWLTLITATLAIPSLGFIIVTMTGLRSVMGILVFMVVCWACTYFGMQLFKHPNMHDKKDVTR